EEEVLAIELKKPTLKAWYRNPTGTTAALAVPYVKGGTARTMYPDFLFIHEVDGEPVFDILDPHRQDLGDTGPKWYGLAKYAEKHGAKFHRVLAVIKDTQLDALVSLDLKNPEIAKK